jgi:hypothetical protein
MSIKFAVKSGISQEGECLIEKKKTAKATFFLCPLSKYRKVLIGLSPLNR